MLVQPHEGLRTLTLPIAAEVPQQCDKKGQHGSEANTPLLAMLLSSDFLGLCWPLPETACELQT